MDKITYEIEKGNSWFWKYWVYRRVNGRRFPYHLGGFMTLWGARRFARKQQRIDEKYGPDHVVWRSDHG